MPGMQVMVKMFSTHSLLGKDLLEAKGSLDRFFELARRDLILNLDLEAKKNNYLPVEHFRPPTGGDRNSPDAGCV
jgi:hypothetical protein